MGETISLHGFVKNLDEKLCRIALNKDYGHYFRAILCLFRPDFPQNPCSTDFSRIIAKPMRAIEFFSEVFIRNLLSFFQFINLNDLPSALSILH
jgi:hypothetical protein